MFLRLIQAAVLSLIILPAFAQQTYFFDVSRVNLPTLQPERKLPETFRALGADVQALKNFLWTLPSEQQFNNRAEAPIMLFPMPDGSTQRFRVWESAIQETGMSQKFPEIKTFTGQGIDDPYATVRMDFNPYFGFHAQVLSINGDFNIDPWQRGNTMYYHSYYRKEYKSSTGFSCYVDEDPNTEQLLKTTSVQAGPCRGTQIYTYRLAVACTGEYAVAVGGNTPAALHSAIVTTVNRVNGVYEKELAIRLILIENNDLIEFMNPATDPFNGNNSSGTLINESQSVITNTIGSVNFDVGHTFSTGGGGLAGLGVVCNNASKARGITGRANPVGDPFDIDYVAHEIGHQFGGSHTFNSATGSCNGNRSAASAYEVGSGTTIQAYAGICGTDNIQPNSDPYFHARSYDQMTLFIEAGGASCRGVINTGNTIPVITSMPSNGASIPLLTPFKLTATATDADGDAITYNWEGWDLGTAGTWSSGGSSTTAPLFKSRIPKSSGTRTFPDIAVILAGFPANPGSIMGGQKGETLPSVGRTMKFRLTVRDNRAGGGAITSGGDGCQASFAPVFQINAVPGTGPFVVTAPNGGESFPGGSTQNVTWNVAGTSAAPINTANVRITLSTDGGFTYPVELLASTPNDGNEQVVLPPTATTLARVRVEAINNVYFDISNNNFTISAAVSGFDFNNPPAASIACSGPSTASLQLESFAFGGFATPINLSASGHPAGTTVEFGNNPLTPGNATTVTLTNTQALSAGNYTITVTGIAGTITRTRIVNFTIVGTPPSIITQPVSQTICTGASTGFTVNAQGAINYQWQISTNGGASYADLPGATNNSYQANNVSAGMNANRYRVFITGNCGATVTSAAAILQVITPAQINTHPALTTVCAGDAALFFVTASGSGNSYQWQVSSDGGNNFTNIQGAQSAVLPIDATTNQLNNNRYRVLVWNATCTNPTVSLAATLVVNILPTVELKALPYTKLLPGLRTTITGQTQPVTGLSYTWFKDGSSLNILDETIDVGITGLGQYRLRVEDANGCADISNVLRISDSVSSNLFIYPSPNNGNFTVAYYHSGGGNSVQQVMVYNAGGALVFQRSYKVAQPYQLHPVTVFSAARGVYMVIVKDGQGNQLASGKVLVH